MEIRELSDKAAMLEMLPLLNEVYPKLTLAQYSDELDDMLPHNYGQVGVYKNGECVGLTGYWIGSKLWCGKYMELDNVVVAKAQRSSGVGDFLFDYMRDKAKKLNCTMLALDSYTDNFSAHKFFFRKQYVPRGFHFIHVLKPEKIR
jgi:GNAT superfamily N-acetyltransferase